MKQLLNIIAFLIPLTLKAQWNGIYYHADVENAFQVINKDTVVAVTQGGGRIHRTTDGGKSWSFFQTIFTSSWFTDVHFPTQKVGYACGGTAFGVHTCLIAKTTDGGTTWDSLTSNAFNTFVFNKIHFVNADTGFVGGELNGLLRTFDGGKSFNKINFPQKGSCLAITFVSQTEGFVSTSEYLSTGNYVFSFLHTLDLGASWSTVYADTMQGVTGVNVRDISQIYFVDKKHGFAVGGNGLFLKTIDGGLTWNTSFIAPYTGLSALFFTSQNVGYVNNAGGIYKTTDGGNTWTVQKISPLSIITKISFANDSIGYALANDGIYKTTNGGGQITGLNKLDADNDVYIFLNSSTYTLSVNHNSTAIRKVSIYNTSGVLVKEVQANFANIDVTGLTKGIYITTISTDNFIISRKLMLN